MPKESLLLPNHNTIPVNRHRHTVTDTQSQPWVIGSINQLSRQASSFHHISISYLARWGHLHPAVFCCWNSGFLQMWEWSWCRRGWWNRVWTPTEVVWRVRNAHVSCVLQYILTIQHLRNHLTLTRISVLPITSVHYTYY